MTSPAAGEDIASRCVVVMRGGRKPFVVDDTSSKAVADGDDVPIPMLPLGRIANVLPSDVPYGVM